MDQIEKWVGICFMLLVFGMGFMAWKSQDMRQTCRIEMVKAGKTADDVMKICP
jgi:preprotein translocase subunit YajC